MAHSYGSGYAYRNAHRRCTEAPSQNAPDGHRYHFCRRRIVVLWLTEAGSIFVYGANDMVDRSSYAPVPAQPVLPECADDKRI